MSSRVSLLLGTKHLLNCAQYGDPVDGVYVASVQFWCHGCRHPHGFLVGPAVGDSPRWSYNADHDAPVFGPSLIMRWNQWTGHDTPPLPKVCHVFVGCNGAQPGEVIYLPDCTHDHAGRVMPLDCLDDHPGWFARDH